MSNKIQLLIEIDKKTYDNLINNDKISIMDFHNMCGAISTGKNLSESTNGDVFNSIIDVDNDCVEVEGKDGKMMFTVTQKWWNNQFKKGE